MENNILQYLQPRTQSLLARIFNMAGKAGETLVNAGHVTSTLRNCYFSDREGGGRGGGGMLEVKLEDQQFLFPKFFNHPCEFYISSFSKSTAIDEMDQYFL